MGLGESFSKKKGRPPEASTSKPSRVRLTWINGVPKVQDARLLLAEAQKNKGMPCELPIRAVLGVFVLSCQSDHLSTEPCWTLYEGDDGSKQLWSYMNENPDMIADIVSMSVTEKGAKTEVNMPKPDNSESVPRATATNLPPVADPQPGAATYAQAATMPTMPDPNQPYDSYSGWSGQQPGSLASDPNMQLQYQPPDWGAQPAPPANNWAQAPMAPADGGWGAQSSEWNTGAPQAQPSAWGAAAPQAQPPGWATNPAASDSPWLPSAAAGTASTSAPEQTARFIKSLDNRPEVTIGELSMDPTLPPSCVDAALKLQEMVLTGHFPDNVAVQALKLAALNNGVLDDGVILRAKAEASADPNEIAKQAAAILQNAGLLAEVDISRACNNLAKHNNNFADALISSGKVDKLLLEAAQECQPMLTEGRMRHDQAIIALHYCHRSRVRLKDAISELSIELL